MKDWWITDYQAYFNQSQAKLNVDCLEDEDNEVLSLSFENRNKLCSELHKMEHFFAKIQCWLCSIAAKNIITT